ncbi:GlxA family transcriptional regulator [Pleomorphovibrio marinus]|uniref:GlxA family transcriptional regulator n=1 Tax=Pleomorphovibrio marinus TaxID=2164132 RepID=UPI000E0AC360|nr:helix-turn-helix domain-containing protein [Pleomorphovibrio marinus]
MKTIGIIVPRSAVTESVANPRYLFKTANQFLEGQGVEPLFDVILIGEEKEVPVHDGYSLIRTDALIKEEPKVDVLIIPALFGDLKETLNANQALKPYIQSQYAQGAEVASLCIGAFLLANTGLLNGKKCSTHWARYQEFKTMFPEVELVDGGIITEENRIYSSGGANSYWNLLLYLLEKYTNRDTAILASKFFAVDIDRQSQAAFMMFAGQKDHGDQAILKVQQYIEEHYEERLMIDDLAKMVALSRRSFERRFKEATQNPVLGYVQRVKMEVAKRSFEASKKQVAEVMYEVGYTDPKAFRTVFKKTTGLTPLAYRNKYQKINGVQV